MEEERLLKEIGKRVKARRKELSLTQAQLSYSCSTDSSYIRKVEAGKVNISMIRLAAIVQALNTTLSEFLADL